MAGTDDHPTTTSERILESALTLFAERGYGSTSVKAIAGRAGVSQGLMYNYFPSKGALLAAIFQAGMRDVERSWRAGEAGDPLENLRDLLGESFRLVREHATFWRLFYALRFQHAALTELEAETGAWAARIHERLTRYCADLGVAQPEVEAHVLFAFIDGVAQRLVLDEAYPSGAVTKALLARYALLHEPQQKGDVKGGL